MYSRSLRRIENGRLEGKAEEGRGRRERRGGEGCGGVWRRRGVGVVATPCNPPPAQESRRLGSANKEARRHRDNSNAAPITNVFCCYTANFLFAWSSVCAVPGMPNPVDSRTHCTRVFLSLCVPLPFCSRRRRRRRRRRRLASFSLFLFRSFPVVRLHHPSGDFVRGIFFFFFPLSLSLSFRLLFSSLLSSLLSPERQHIKTGEDCATLTLSLPGSLLLP